jgi:glycosyltransferase involved in cell wall biosynthesis
MKISVIVPVYNGEKYINNCIKSICSQTIKDIEIIIVDDGSIDNTYAILCDIKNTDARIVLHKQNNQGQSVARNIGIEMAHGDYIAFIDSDDLIECDMLERLYSFAVDKECQIVCCGYLFVDEKNKILKKKTKYETTLMFDDSIFKDAVLVNNIKSVPWNKLYLRSLIVENKIKFLVGSLNEDFLFTIQASFHSKKVGFINTPLYKATVNPNSISRKMTNKNLVDMLRVLDQARIFLLKNDVYEKYEQIYKISFVKFINFHLFNALHRTNNIKEWLNEIKKTKYEKYYNDVKKYLPLKHRLISFLFLNNFYQILKIFKPSLY